MSDNVYFITNEEEASIKLYVVLRAVYYFTNTNVALILFFSSSLLLFFCSRIDPSAMGIRLPRRPSRPLPRPRQC